MRYLLWDETAESKYPIYAHAGISMLEFTKVFPTGDNRWELGMSRAERGDPDMRVVGGL